MRWVPGRVLGERTQAGVRQFKISLDLFVVRRLFMLAHEHWLQSGDASLLGTDRPVALWQYTGEHGA